MKVLFVCLGNICRSPTAEGIFRKMIKERGLDHLVSCDSAGTSAYHSGSEADGRMQEHSKQRGYELTSLSRLLTIEDLENFDLILTMDHSNFHNTHALDTESKYTKKIVPMLSYCKVHDVEEVPDPYFGNGSGFQLVIDMLEDSCEQLVNVIEKKIL